MTIRRLFLATTALSVAAVPAAAAPRRHQAANSQLSGMKAELDELRAEVRDLQQRLSEQVAAQGGQGQAAAQAAQATQTAQAAQAAALASSAQTQQVATQQTQLAARLDKDEHPTAIAYKGVKITPGGFFELSGVYRNRNQASDLPTPFNAIPYANVRTSQTSEARLSARHSRLSALVEGDASKTLHLSGYAELDFLGAAQTANSNESNSYNPRIRNLYATADWKLDGGTGLHLLAGQSWSLVTLNSKGITPRNEVQPLAIDPQYVPGYAWTRQPQLRLAADFLDHKLWLAVSAENPQTTFYTTGTPAGAAVGTAGTAAALPGSDVYNITGAGSFNSANTLSLNKAPDVVGKVAYEATIAGRTVHAEAFALYRNFADRTNNANYSASSVSGGGGLIAQLLPGRLDAQVSGMVGRGIGRYGTSQLPDVTFRPDGTIAPIHEYMLLAGLIAHPTKMLDVYGFAGEEVAQRRYYTTAAGLAYGYGNPLYTNAGCLIEGSTVCNGNTHDIRQFEVGFWQRLYQGPWGRVQVGAEYSHTARHAFTGVGGQPGTENDIGFLSFRYYPF